MRGNGIGSGGTGLNRAGGFPPVRVCDSQADGSWFAPQCPQPTCKAPQSEMTPDPYQPVTPRLLFQCLLSERLMLTSGRLNHHG